MNPGNNDDFNRRVEALNLPKPWQIPEGTLAPNVKFVRICGRRVVVAGHNPLDQDGLVAGPFGVVGESVSRDEAKVSSAVTMRAILANLQHELGDLSKVGKWVKLDGWVNAARGFTDLPAIMNPASEMILDLYGPVAGAHARYVVGVTGLPFNAPVELAAEVELTACIATT